MESNIRSRTACRKYVWGALAACGCLLALYYGVRKLKPDKDQGVIRSEGSAFVILQAHHSGVVGISFSENGSYLASVGDDGSVALWNTLDWSLNHQLGGQFAEAVVFSSDGSNLAVVVGNGRLSLWKPDLSERVRYISGAYRVRQVGMGTASNRLLFTNWNDRESIESVLIPSLTGHAKYLVSHEGVLHRFALVNNRSEVWTTGSDKSIAIFDQATGRHIQSITSPMPYANLEASAKSSLVAIYPRHWKSD